MKLTGLSEQFDAGHDVFVQQEGAHVQIAVDCTSGDNAGRALLTPSQAKSLAAALLQVAAVCDQVEDMDGTR